MAEPPVPVVSPPELPAPVTLVCANCGAALQGAYCSACGQRHEPHVHTMAHFASEAFESITHADSRLWQTLGYLLTRPGRLTQEFFAGHRVRYLPPFRLYLVVSVLFFLISVPQETSLKPEQTSQAMTSAAAVAKSAAEGEAAAAAMRAAAQARETELRAAGKQFEAEQRLQAGADVEEDDGIRIQMSGVDVFCAEFVDQPDSDNNYRTRLRENCRQLSKDDGREIGTKMLQNVPRAMFVFLPLLALILKPLYWRPKRYYVEHLLFLVHNHAFAMLAITLVVLVGYIPYVGDSWFTGLLTAAVILYMMWYMFRAMRNYYGQGRSLTLVKYVFFGFTYFVLTGVMLLLTLLFSAMV
jgi:hypothetical protein